MSADVRSDLIDDLTYLRKGPGITPERLRNASAVVAACGGAEQPTETLLERLTAAVRSIHGLEGGPALWAAYGLDPSPDDADLTARRRRYAASVGISAYTVREQEDRAIEELALRLMSRFWAGAPLPEELPIPHGGLLIQELVTTYLYRDRRFVESQQRRTIISLVDGAAGFQYGTYTPTELFDVRGGTVESRDVNDGTIHTIRFPQRLRRAQQHRFGFREREAAVDPDAETPTQDRAGQTFESPTLYFRVEACFIGDVPSVIWAYDKLSRIERPGAPEDGVQLKPAGNIVAADFADLYGGLASGIAWRWV